MAEITNTSVDSDVESSSDDESEVTSPSRYKRAVKWTPNLAHSSIWSKPPGNPNYGPRMQLYSATGWNLAIYNEINVRGSQEDFDKHTFLELSYAGIPGHVHIQCLGNSIYLAMNRKGRLYGETDKSDESTIFIESLQGSYNTYLSKKYAHLGWYIGLKKSGKQKRGVKTGYNQKAVKFLPRRSNFN